MSSADDIPPAGAGPAARGRSRDSVFLSAGSVVNGLLAYAFFILASRSLGAVATAPVSVLWTFWAVTGAILTLPVQLWTVRHFTVDGHEGTVRRSVPSLGLAVGGLAAGIGVGSYAFAEQLFGVRGVAFPLMVAAITVGSFVMGLVRGVLSGRGRYSATATSLVTENAVRVAAAAVVAANGGGAIGFGIAMSIGPLSALLWVRSLRLGTGPTAKGGRYRPLAVISGIAGGSLIAQIVLTGAPAALALAGGAPAEVTGVFLALSVWRAPYLVMMGVAPQLTSVLTRMVTAGPPGRVVRALWQVIAVVAAGCTVAAVLGLTVLEPLLEVVFGIEVGITPGTLAVLGVATGVALGNLVLLTMLVALGCARTSTGAWVAALGAGGLWAALSPLAPTPSIAVSFLLAESVAFVLMAAVARRAAGRVTTVSAIPS